MAIYGLLVRDPILAELAAECLIDQHVHGLRDAHHCGERHSPCRVVEASAGGNAAALAIVRMSRKRYAKLAAHSR